MSIARFSTEPGRLREALRSTADLGALLGFRLAGLRGRARHAAPMALAFIAVMSLAACVVPAFLPEYDVTRDDVLVLLPSAYVSVLVVSVVSAATSGGGRELLAREHSAAFPVSPTTDHLGALLMAPLNIAWLLQCWAVLAATSYGVGADPGLLPALLPVLAWLVAATALAQALAWLVEWVRRGPHGVLVVPVAGGVLLAVMALVVVVDRVAWVLDRSPTLRIAVGVLDGRDAEWAPWSVLMVELLVLAAASVVLGGWLAGRAARRPVRDELNGESAARAARPHPTSDLLAMVRVDRVSIWRSVPMRRGMVVLALFPGLVAVGGSFRWDILGVFPGLVASGGALLFGVNSWCLDGRGALWRDSLPGSARLAFAARTLVLAETLVVATTVTLLLASLRAGAPTVSQLVAVLCASVVVIVQVLATAMRWSVRRPYAVDLRSSRATPAPPLVMVGYSSRLALSTTFTGLLFNMAASSSWVWSPLVAVPFLAWSALKLHRTARAWADPSTRSAVIATTAS